MATQQEMRSSELIRIYSVGVWNSREKGRKVDLWLLLEFTPLEFETLLQVLINFWNGLLEFTPLEFETLSRRNNYARNISD